jgi:hypothetical protein
VSLPIVLKEFEEVINVAFCPVPYALCPIFSQKKGEEIVFAFRIVIIITFLEHKGQ